MTLRPLRPLQSARPSDDNHNNHNHIDIDIDIDIDIPNHENGGPTQQLLPQAKRQSGPIATPPVLPLMKRATCSQCRVRKVRCDGREGVCHNCDRLGFECSFQQAAGRLSGERYAVKSPERRRRMQACNHCHLKKTRCHGEQPRCSNCVRKGRECVYPAAKKQGAATTKTNRAISDEGGRSSTTTPSREIASQQMAEPANRGNAASWTAGMARGTALTDVATVVEHMEDYFTHLYPLPSFAFLHKSTVIRRCRDGTINEPLKLAICAVTSLHLQRTSLCHHLWAQQAEQLILQQISRPSIFHLQALLLVVRYRIESGEFPTAFMLAALAARTAAALRLNYERTELAPVAQEARRRLYWALYLLDDYFCVGLREFELCPEETIYLQLPCREEIFAAGLPCQTGMLQLSASDDVAAMGLRGAFMRLTWARRAVMRFNRRVGLNEESPSTIGDRIRQFEHELARLRAALSPEHQYSVSNLAATAWPAQFVMLHMSYFQCHCDLYRMFLNGYSEAAPSRLLASISPQDRITMQAHCLEHAESIIRILGDFLNQHPDADDGPRLLLERDAAVCAFEGARLVMFGARLPCAASTLETALHKARAVSLRFIARFFPYSASTRTLQTALEHLIASYTQRQAAQAREALLSEPEPAAAAAPRAASSKISQYASSRQRLSVQSLLLQSDFADDSHEIAAHPPPTSAPAPMTTSSLPSLPPLEATFPPPRLGTPSVGGTGDVSTPISVPSSSVPATPVPRNMLLPPSIYSNINNNSNTNQQPPPTSRPASSPSPWGGVTIDARREDAGLIFNPWMGFTAPEEFYGVSEGLSEEY